MNVQTTDREGTLKQASLDCIPDACPQCGKHGQPEYICSTYNRVSGELHGVFRCPVGSCRGLYIAVYRQTAVGGTLMVRLVRSVLARFSQKKAFAHNISNISPNFCEIYNQSLVAEENGLNQVCGPGYRKALEFLIKDFLTGYRFRADPAKQEEVKKCFLGPVVENFINEDRIKQCAKRAAWLGNDEVHYLRKWTDKDVHDLKSLIMITANYVDMVVESERYIDEMPAGSLALPKN